ncbi:hypothetical protein OG948_35420 (plasmid) [Embleya sp. NBC_00888]|uniref:hypothetical protein n=1 Tax=Embleya sp. NBC_00888 TaxID=2975960 RepID=UPI002F916216|nr:hypothetical protein OG948_35420 [Embleya sp. NBC_00888]
MLAELVYHVAEMPEFAARCESDEFRFKMVLYDALHRGFRLRLHVWRHGFADTPHQHRFSYASRILSGGYEHTTYTTGQDLAPPHGFTQFDRHIPLGSEPVGSSIDSTEFKVTGIFPLGEGDYYFQSSDMDLSSTTVAPDTVTLFVRGPAVRPCSFQWHSQSETVTWRAGDATAPDTRRQEVAVQPEEVEEVFVRLRNLKVIP